jgi:hypothetical protein
MTSDVGPELHPSIHANAYAGLKELEHMTKLGYKKVMEEGRLHEEFAYKFDSTAQEIPKVEKRPFFLSFVFDRPGRQALLSPKSTIADAIFLHAFTPATDHFHSEFDNYSKEITGLTTFPGTLRQVGLGYAKNYGCFGAAVLVLPGEDLLEYCAHRFAAHAIRSQITFGVDPTHTGDPRALALARLAIDYGDLKFQKMAKEAQVQAINQAFLDSVREMARQDENEGEKQAFWYLLVETIDKGRVTGTDEKGEEIRNESTLNRVSRLLEEARDGVLGAFSIKERSFVFHKEGVNQYRDLFSGLKNDIRTARQIAEDRAKGLVTSAREGEMIAALKLDPISERFLVLRLLDLCQTSWLPEASKARDKAAKGDLISNRKLEERLSGEMFETLKEAAAGRGLFGRGEKAFLEARDEAQERFVEAGANARRFIEADLRVKQVRALLEHLQARSRQYARLSTQMDTLVNSLENKARRYLNHEAATVIPFDMRVEVFETLYEPRRRIWDEVYSALFIEEGAYLSTFDREVLSETIKREMAPKQSKEGKIVERSTQELVNDFSGALLNLGRSHLRRRILGEDTELGLDLASGLELEARLVLGKELRTGEKLDQDAIHEYMGKKFKALDQISGVLGRVVTAEARALNDGVKPSRARQLIIRTSDRGASQDFLDRFREAVKPRDRGISREHGPWSDPRLAILHDVVLPIPLYYFEPITGELEEAYLEISGDPERSYNLHTDYNWEKSLPNLNPRKGEVSVDWSVNVLAEALITGVIRFEHGEWICHLRDDREESIGPSFSSALYHIAEWHLNTVIRQMLERQLSEEGGKLDPEKRKSRTRELLNQVVRSLEDAELNRTREELLDRPILNVLKERMEDSEAFRSSQADTSSRYGSFNIE